MSLLQRNESSHKDRLEFDLQQDKYYYQDKSNSDYLNYLQQFYLHDEVGRYMGIPFNRCMKKNIQNRKLHQFFFRHNPLQESTTFSGVGAGRWPYIINHHVYVYHVMNERGEVVHSDGEIIPFSIINRPCLPHVVGEKLREKKIDWKTWEKLSFYLLHQSTTGIQVSTVSYTLHSFPADIRKNKLSHVLNSQQKWEQFIKKYRKKINFFEGMTLPALSYCYSSYQPLPLLSAYNTPLVNCTVAYWDTHTHTTETQGTLPTSLSLSDWIDSYAVTQIQENAPFTKHHSSDPESSSRPTEPPPAKWLNVNVDFLSGS